jgi:hypothetical protein
MDHGGQRSGVGVTEPSSVDQADLGVELCLLCSYHHKLVHEYGWWMILDEPGTARWCRPSDRRYDPGPRPGDRAPPERAAA